MKSKLHIKDKCTRTQSLKTQKTTSIFLKVLSLSIQRHNYLEPLSGNVFKFSINQVQQNNIDQINLNEYKSDLELKPIQ